MKQYHDLLEKIINEGRSTGDRTRVGTKSIFGHQLRFNLQEGLPIVTTKRIHLKSVIHELLWMLSGDTNIDYLQQNGVRIWNEWADENGDLGPIYGAQWRNWNNDDIDQIKDALETLRYDSTSRRIIVNSWNPSVLPDTTKSFDENVANGKAALPPCHSFFQFKAYDISFEERIRTFKQEHYSIWEDTKPSERQKIMDELNLPTKTLHLQLYQRSADVFLGVPFNIAFYAILLEMFAKELGMISGDFIHTFGDAHIYNNHFDKVELQLSREHKILPTLWLNPEVESIFDYDYDDIKVLDYKYHPGIKAKVAI